MAGAPPRGLGGVGGPVGEKCVWLYVYHTIGLGARGGGFPVKSACGCVCIVPNGEDTPMDMSSMWMHRDGAERSPIATPPYHPPLPPGEPSEEGEVDEEEDVDMGPADARGFFHRRKGGEQVR